MKNENLTKEMLKNSGVDMDNLLDDKQEKSNSDIKKIADILNIEPCDLAVPKYHKEHEIVICKKDMTKPKFYPSEISKKYQIYNLARANKMPNLKGFIVEVLSDDITDNDMFDTSLHSYIYNYKDAEVEIVWIYENNQYSKILQSGDSIYIQPFIKYGFKNNTGIESALCVSRVSGSVNVCAQKELSYFANISRIVSESKCWFN